MRRTLRPTSRGAGTVGEVPSVPDGVLQVCHPQWRGARSSAIAFGDPVLEAHDLGALVDRLPDITASGASTIVIQGWPPNAGALAVAASQAGLRVLTNKAEAVVMANASLDTIDRRSADQWHAFTQT